MTQRSTLTRKCETAEIQTEPLSFHTSLAFEGLSLSMHHVSVVGTNDATVVVVSLTYSATSSHELPQRDSLTLLFHFLRGLSRVGEAPERFCAILL